MRRKSIGVTIGLCLVLFFLLARSAGVLVDWAWFGSVGYSAVFWTVFDAKLALFLAVFVATAALLWINAEFALHYAMPRSVRLAAAADRRLSTVEALPSSPAAALVPEFPLFVWRLIAL